MIIFWYVAIVGAFGLGFVVAAVLVANKHLECIICNERKKQLVRQLIQEFQDE